MTSLLSSPLLFCESLGVGFVMAAPVGPVGVLCIRRSLRLGATAGFVTGLGVAAADSFYAAVASFGLSSISGLLVGHEQLVRLVGGVILLIIGWQIYKSPMPSENVEEGPTQYIRDFVSALLLAFMNPLTILSFAAMYISLGFGQTTAGNSWLAWMFVIGIGLGSSTWWLLLSLGTARLKSRITSRTLLLINRGCGIVIALFGLFTLGSYLLKLRS